MFVQLLGGDRVQQTQVAAQFLHAALSVQDGHAVALGHQFVGVPRLRRGEVVLADNLGARAGDQLAGAAERRALAPFDVDLDQVDAGGDGARKSNVSVAMGSNS